MNQKNQNDGVTSGVHTFTPQGYIPPQTELLRENLARFCDWKLGLMMHFGPYTEAGLIESWALCDEDASWSRKQIDWTQDMDAFKRQYYGLNRSFNPIRFDPERWAHMAADGGFRYLIFTMKHHDGFCMYDTAYTDYKVTSPDCPYSADPKADIAGSLFAAFRRQGLGISAYFSKPDWHSDDFWENCGIGYKTTRYPTYDTAKNPEKWASFVRFLHAQVTEIADRYEPDVLWFDGGWVRRDTGTDPKMEELIAKVREKHPGILSANRTVTGCMEDFITPEQTIPKHPLTVPFESCITMTQNFSFRFEDRFRTPRNLVHLLMRVVSRGGNLALNITPQPDGAISMQTSIRMAALGAWLRTMGDAVYATRIAAPYEDGQTVYTGSKDGTRLYATVLWRRGEHAPDTLSFRIGQQRDVKAVRALSGAELPFEREKDGTVTVRLKDTAFLKNLYADAFCLSAD